MLVGLEKLCCLHSWHALLPRAQWEELQGSLTLGRNYYTTLQWTQSREWLVISSLLVYLNPSHHHHLFSSHITHQALGCTKYPLPLGKKPKTEGRVLDASSGDGELKWTVNPLRNSFNDEGPAEAVIARGSEPLGTISAIRPLGQSPGS